ncbi:SRPBCC family protein [Gordonia hankookensis]|uniref:SRPBCC family protein n=1 Tax=Gordonia hankookensis TaxID=589403 RepID=A0ABR7W6Z6_9ACTN|nr:SRPBCC family protein [Gordonia hankookensis]MBD1318596.1 SRPBCC family protein [Gordonia hankookensis]
METVTVERTIDAPVDTVFAWISNAHNYTRTPLVVSERLRTPGRDAPYGVGAIRVLTWLIGWFAERITAYVPPHSFDYHVYRSFPPSRHEAGQVTVDDVGGASRVIWTTTFELAIPLLGPMLTRRVGKPLVGYAFGRVLDGAAKELSAEPPQ